MTRAQIVMEFVAVMAFAMLLSFVYILVAANGQERARENVQEAETLRIARMIQDELIVAAQVQPGYRREVWLPDTIVGRNYTINGSSSFVQVRAGEASATLRVPPFAGTIAPGLNVITVLNGSIIVS